MSKKLTPNPEAIRILKDIFTKDELVEISERLKEEKCGSDMYLYRFETVGGEINNIWSISCLVGGFFKCVESIREKCIMVKSHQIEQTKLFI